MIGDVLASTIVCEQLKLHYPEAQVHFLIDEHTTAVALGNPFIDDIVVFKKAYRKNITQFLSFLGFIKQQRYDVVVDLLCKAESSLITLITGARTRLSYPKWYSKWCYTKTFKHSQKPATDLGTAIDNRLLLLQPLFKEYHKDHLSPKIYLNEQEKQDAANLLSKYGLNKKRPLIMLGILGSGPLKTYPLEYMAQLINAITKKYDVQLLLNYMPSQQLELAQLLSKCSEKSKSAIYLDVYGKSLREFLNLLSHCHAYIGNEGGASHMSKAMDIPNFSIFAPWISKEAWMTFKKNPKYQGVHLGDYFPDAVRFTSKKERKRKIPDNYRLFKPQLFMEHLFSFIDSEILSNQ